MMEQISPLSANLEGLFSPCPILKQNIETLFIDPNNSAFQKELEQNFTHLLNKDFMFSPTSLSSPLFQKEIPKICEEIKERPIPILKLPTKKFKKIKEEIKEEKKFRNKNT